MACLWRLAALQLLLCHCAALVPPRTRHQQIPGRRRTTAYASFEFEIQDKLALGGDVAVLFLYSYTQKSLDTIYAVTATFVDGVQVDEMDCFQNPSFAAAALSLAWVCCALPQGAFRFDATRGGVSDRFDEGRSSVSIALVMVARCGGLAVAAVLLLLYARAYTAGTPVSPQDAGFAAGILPIVGTWRYVLADTSAKL
jgi:hypothetical protein